MQRDLVIRAQGGDHQAFTALVAGSVDRLFNVARLILQNNERAEDAVQEALLQAGAGIGGLRDPDRFDAWIQRLLVRACYRSARQERGTRAMDLGHFSIGDAAGRGGGSSIARHDQLERGFRRLSPDQRAVLVVHHFLELGDHDAEEVLGIRAGTLESRMNRATNALRAALEAEERGGIAGEAVGTAGHDALDRALGDWFHTDARERAPTTLLDAVSAGARRLPGRPAWGLGLSLRALARRARSRRAVLRLALVAALGSLLVVGLILAGPQKAPRLGVGWLAYVHNGDIYVADAAGNGSRRIVHADGVTFFNVAWSPAGRWLVAEADSGTILIDPVTGAATFVGGSGPVWSPDGRQLAVVDYLPVGSRLRIVDAETLSTVRTYPIPVGGGLAWSPNGRWIAANGECSGPGCPPDSNGGTGALIRVDVATGEIVQLDLPAGQGGGLREPAWSPDSTHIAFVRWGALCGGFGDSGGCGSDVFVADADGANRQQLNRVTGQADQPAWSADGSWISWRTVDINGSGRRATTTSHGITLEHPDGTGERLIAGAGTVGYAWSPDSDRLWLVVQASGASAAILWEAPLVDRPGAIDVSLDPPPEYGPWGLPFAWQALAKGRTAAVLPSAPVATSTGEPAQVTPAPAATANPGKQWPTLRTIGPDSCSLVNVSIGSPNITTIANFCDLAANGWSGAWSPTGSTFAVAQGGSLTIFHADGHQTLIDKLPAIDGVSWSPDGNWLSVTGGTSAYLLRPDGSGIREVPAAPSWSPDGRTMAITRPDGVLLVGPSEGPGLVALGSIPGPSTWAPDGSRFGFIRDGDVWTVAIDGSDPRNVTTLPLGGASSAAWSPDGRWIAVSAFHGVWLVPPTGGDKRWLDFGRGAGVSTVAWSPDSKRVAIETYPQTPYGQPSDSGQTSAVYLVDPDGSSMVRIDDASGPNWSPDGRYLLVSDQQPGGGGDSGIAAVMNGDGTGRTDLPVSGIDTRSLVWAR